MAQKTLVFRGEVFGISYEFVNFDLCKTLIFLHGWGSNKALMKQAFQDCFKEYRHLYIDMPGFGKSTLPPFGLTSKDYQEILSLFLQDLKIEPFAIFGHSFGGKIATLLNPPRLILLSSAGILLPKPFSVTSKIRITKILHKSFPYLHNHLKDFLRSKDIAGMEEVMYQTLKNVVDEDFSEIFANFHKKAWIFWGEDDKVTPLYAGEKIHSLIKDSSFIPLKGDHYFCLTQAKAIEATLLGAFS
ncbi:alpha/beta fold hydrolase [Helicobacter mesocricetorum]|uniref:alpha/beta fold hydrolase n=1 Tax=Helicobacter mesocricetorum TaxID=87012 RepID=UPI000CF1956B|nr:alpha/beta hydrolase [Helicobacter mesocricetorum]